MSRSDSVRTTNWFKSSRSSETQSCVEVKFEGDRVFLRDSKYLRNLENNPATQPTISLTASRWPAFCRYATNPAAALVGTGLPGIEQRPDGRATVSCTETAVALDFLPDEWAAFVAGIIAGEFELVAA